MIMYSHRNEPWDTGIHNPCDITYAIITLWDMYTYPYGIHNPCDIPTWWRTTHGASGCGLVHPSD